MKRPALLLLMILALSATSMASLITPINGWFKYACTAENIKFAKTYFCDNKGNVHCLPGWSDESQMCSVPICDINGKTCVNGNCSRPFTCDCEVGWTGQFCDKCVCLPGCVNGYCNKSLECVCKPGWRGMLCDQPVCTGCIHGDCVMPNMCVCHPGWSGPNCTVCEARSDCIFGRCVNEPFECVCYDGYKGSSCEQPVCREGCHPQYGGCMMPETCICRDGWTGPNCTDCVPYWNCQHGYCNKPWECICDPGFFGLECNETRTTNGNWGPWGSFSQCSVTCGDGIKTRKRKCNNPVKSGNGTYCSLDGSLSTETVPCNLGSCGVNNVDGNWGPWGTYSACSKTCGNGTRTRTRVCNNPPRSGSGSDCPGSSTETTACPDIPPCPIDGGYGQWSVWSICTAKCVGDIGESVRRRTCTNPTPQFGGRNCTDLGPERESRPCNGTIPKQSTNAAAECFTIYQ